MKPKERTAIKRVVMPELDPVYRATTRLEEVNKGLTKEMAMTEAKRCLDCVNSHKKLPAKKLYGNLNYYRLFHH